MRIGRNPTLHGWFSVKAIWFTPPSFSGNFTVRVKRLDGRSDAGMGNQPPGGTFDATAGATANSLRGWRNFPSITWAKEPGCYEWTISGVRFHESIVLRATTPAPERTRSVSDGILRVPLPSGWNGSVALGSEADRRVAWILAGDYTLPRHAASREGGPPVPAHRVLIAIGDFIQAEASRGWKRVDALRLPPAVLRRRGWWHVRFAGRAIALHVSFGSPPPGAATLAEAEHVLAQVTPEAR